MSISGKDLSYPEIICPECDGEGCFDVITNITYDGDVWTRPMQCETCYGNGWIYDPEHKEDGTNEEVGY